MRSLPCPAHQLLHSIHSRGIRAAQPRQAARRIRVSANAGAAALQQLPLPLLRCPRGAAPRVQVPARHPAAGSPGVEARAAARAAAAAKGGAGARGRHRQHGVRLAAAGSRLVEDVRRIAARHNACPAFGPGPAKRADLNGRVATLQGEAEGLAFHLCSGIEVVKGWAECYWRSRQ